MGDKVTILPPEHKPEKRIGDLSVNLPATITAFISANPLISVALAGAGLYAVYIILKDE